jgi:hypothetical protein
LPETEARKIQSGCNGDDHCGVTSGQERRMKMGNRMGVSHEMDNPTPGARLSNHELWHEEQ